tara:strand:- start:646 stop:846 length:201 start_codon:yes stop_codon:yes gene_type:complete
MVGFIVGSGVGSFVVGCGVGSFVVGCGEGEGVGSGVGCGVGPPPSEVQIPGAFTANEEKQPEAPEP